MPNNVTGKCVTIAFTTSAVARNIVRLAPGWYNITADQDCYVEVGDQAVTPAAPIAATAVYDGNGSWPVWGRSYGTDLFIGDGFIGIKGLTASGTLWLKGGVK